jgi:predicted CXXCH cytochrome family protein
VPGEAFWDHYLLAIVDTISVFHPDGQMRDEAYECAPFLGSRMHAAGVTCLDCHDPHTARPKLAGNALCLQCHNGSRAEAPVVAPLTRRIEHLGYCAHREPVAAPVA